MIYNEEVRQEVDKVYKQLGKMAKDLAKEHTKEIDEIIEDLKDVERLTDVQLRNYQMKLSCLAYNLGEIKEHANLRADCASALYKEKQANEYNNLVGTQQAKANQSIVNSVDNQAIHILYTNISKLLSTKLDETHRVVNTLNGILIGRMADNKRLRPEVNEDSPEF